MDLVDGLGDRSTAWRQLRLYIRTGGEHDVSSSIRQFVCLHQIAITSRLLADGEGPDTTLERSPKRLSVLLQVRHNIVSREKTIWIIALILKAWKLCHPVWGGKGERIPAFLAPGLTDLPLFKHNMGQSLAS